MIRNRDELKAEMIRELDAFCFERAGATGSYAKAVWPTARSKVWRRP